MWGPRVSELDIGEESKELETKSEIWLVCWMLEYNQNAKYGERNLDKWIVKWEYKEWDLVKLLEML